jgi:hypothetical protein
VGKSGSAETLLENGRIGPILVQVAVEISLTVAGVAHAVTTRGRRVFLVGAAYTAGAALVIADAGSALDAFYAGAQIRAIGGYRTVIRTGAGNIGYTGVADAVTIIVYVFICLDMTVCAAGPP